MTKTELFEEELIKNGISDERLSEYAVLLRRSGDDESRLQHCYTAALRFAPENAEQAAELIRWGLKNYPGSWFSAYRAYYNMGLVYERAGKYRAAYDAYLAAYDALDESQIIYRRSVSGRLMWTLLHADSFRYSEQLERHYLMFRETDPFEAAFINNEFRLAVAETVVCLHHGRKEEAEAAYRAAVRLSRPGAVSRAQGVLDRHNVADELSVTPECAAFLKSLRM